MIDLRRIKPMKRSSNLASKARFAITSLVFLFFCQNSFAAEAGGVGEGGGEGADAGLTPAESEDLTRTTTPTKKELRENNLTGDWRGWRKTLIDAGVTISAFYTYDMLGNPVGGFEQGFGQDGTFDVDLKLDFERLIGWKGGSFYTLVMYRNGTNLANKIGNLLWPSNIAGGETIWLNEVYFKQTFFDEKLSMKVGRLNANFDFMFSLLYYFYINSAFNGNPVGPFFNTVISADPWATWGFYIDAMVCKNVQAKFAVYNPNEHIFEKRFHGLNASFNTREGAQLWTEWIYQLNQQPKDTGLPGNYTVGCFYYTGKFDTFRGRTQRGNYGYYFLADQKAYQPKGTQGSVASAATQADSFSGEERGITPFVAFTFAPKNRNMMPFFFDVGINYAGPFSKRPDDVLAIAYGYGKISTELRRLQRLAQQGADLNDVMEDLIDTLGDEPQNFEAVIELNYWFQITPWFTFTPDFQYIFNPGGTGNIRDAFVLGARAAVDF
jgi:porin